jgi:hypothetical protein
MILYNIPLHWWEGHMNISFEGLPKKERGELESPERSQPNQNKQRIRPGTNNPAPDIRQDPHGKEAFPDAVSSNQRSLLRTQTTIDGLQNLAAQLQAGDSGRENAAYLKLILDNTRFHDERVLMDYKDTLTEITATHDTERLAALIDEQKQTLLGLTTRDTIAQNIISTTATTNGVEYGTLLQKVVGQIKQSGMPLFDVSRDKVLDLLR